MDLQGLFQNCGRRSLDSKVGYLLRSTNVAQAASATLTRVNKDLAAKAAVGK